MRVEQIETLVYLPCINCDFTLLKGRGGYRRGKTHVDRGPARRFKPASLYSTSEQTLAGINRCLTSVGTLKH